MSLEQIDAKARVYADARDRLGASVAALNEALQELHRDHLPGIKRHLKRAFEHEAELRALIDANRHLFTKPKSTVMHGVKLGLKKGEGRIEYENADVVVARIERKLPELADVLVITTKKPSKTAMAQLTVEQLKAIGATVREAGDQVFITPIDSQVDKLVQALLKSMGDDAAEEQATPE